MTAADGNAEHQHRTENQAEQGDASTPVFAGKRQQHWQFSCEHGGVQRTVKRTVRQRAQRRIRRKDRFKARLPDRQTEQPEQKKRKQRTEHGADERQPAHVLYRENEREQQRHDHPQGGGVAYGQRQGEKLRTGGEHRAARHGAEQHEQRRGQGGKAVSPAQTAERGQGGNAAVRQLRTEPEKQSGKHGERTEYGDAGSKAMAGEEADKLPARGKARADNAAQKCQRTKKDIHAIPP